MKEIITLRDKELKKEYAKQAWRLRKAESDLYRAALNSYLQELKSIKPEKHKG